MSAATWQDIEAASPPMPAAIDDLAGNLAFVAEMWALACHVLESPRVAAYAVQLYAPKWADRLLTRWIETGTHPAEFEDLLIEVVGTDLEKMVERCAAVVRKHLPEDERGEA